MQSDKTSSTATAGQPASAIDEACGGADVLLSLVVPCYNVEPYLDAFFKALMRQHRSSADVELVLVNDGSTDTTGDRLHEWAHRLPFATRVLDKPNGGPASARNLGLAHARGTWVSFPDPDDVLAPGYLRTVIRFLRSEEATAVDLVATNILYLDDATGQIRNAHPLRRRFEGARRRIISLDEQPSFIHLSGGTAFVRRERIVEHGLEFDLRVRPNFEDAAFIARYLLTRPQPRIAFLRDAHYHYRRRADGSSLTQGSLASPLKYTHVLEFGHLETLRAAHRLHATVPVWLQNVIVYDLLWYFRADARIHTPTAAQPPEVLAKFFDLLAEILPYIDPETIRTYRTTPVQPQLRATLLRLREPKQPLDRIHVWHIDHEQSLAVIKYYWAAEEPALEVFIDGVRTPPVFTKARSVDYFGRTLMWERIAWFPADGRLTATVDGRAVPVVTGPPREDTYELDLARRAARRRRRNAAARRRGTPTVRRANRTGTGRLSARRLLRRARRAIAPRRRIALARSWAETQRERAFDALVLRAARSAWARRKFRKCWILTDRDTQAQDNAEHLYRYLMNHEPDVNAWFALDKRSPDWRRLEREGFRLLPDRSWRHMVALLHCAELISSHVDNYVIRPYAGRPYPAPRWRFTFLQHGVTKDDLSRWVNPKRPSLVLSATHDEHQAFVGDATPYTWTEREVALTGFPRHDKLLELAGQTSDRDRDLVVLMPTWRRSLLGEQVAGGNLRRLLPGFWESEFMTSWLGLAGSTELQDAAAKQGYRVVFFPHPNLQDYVTADRVPAGVELMRYADVDVQEILARARVVVTDYSSLAFEAAYIDRPVVYFQFDADTFYDGSHAYRRGYFDYDKQGFGPVCHELAAASAAVTGIIRRTGALDPLYAERIAETFAYRDGRACERTVDAIRARRRPYHEW